MARKTPPTLPILKCHKASGRAYVWLDEKRHYLGKHGTPEARTAYDRLIAEWLAGGRRLRSDDPDLTVVEMIAAYLVFAETYYKKPGRKKNHELCDILTVTKIVRKLYGRTPAADFGPKRLKAVRAAMVEKGWARKRINKQIGRVVRMCRAIAFKSPGRGA